jgi:transcriptional regulator with GAF, ATPase, and Fis domain
MTEASREEVLIDTFASLADTMVAGYDVVDLLQSLVESCTNLLEIAAAGILLADENGELDVVASSSEAARLVELMQISAEAGPCIESFATGVVVVVADIALAPLKWSRFRDSAIEQGFGSICAIPRRLRDTTIGALNLLSTGVGELAEADVKVARALADVATIGILQERALAESAVVREQLSQALQSRVVIEQAKGVLSQTRSVSTEDAFTLMRAYARSNRLKLSEVAQRVVSRDLHI